jgi:hypothetical protein
MDIYEKKQALRDYCDKHPKCSGCGYNLQPISWCDDFTSVTIPEDLLDKTLKEIGILKDEPKEVEAVEEAPVEHDVVNHPSHYCREGAMESIDEMVLLFGKEAVKGFCLCNAWKYRYRSAEKNGLEDLRKSDWYIRKFKELSEDGTTKAF